MNRTTIGNIAIVAGLLVITGWLFDIQLLKSVIPGLVTMKFGTAFAFVLTGFLFRELAHKKRNELHIKILSISVITIMSVFLAAGFTNLVSAEWLPLASRDSAQDTVISGLPSVGTIISFIALAAAALAAGKKHGQKYAEVLGMFTVLLGLSAILGHLIGMPTLYYSFPDVSTGMAIHTAALFVLLGTCFVQCKTKSI